MRKIIAKYTAYDGIRDEEQVVTVYEERYRLGYLYTVNVEDERDLRSYEHDTMEEALEAAREAVREVQPTNGGVPAFDEA